MKTTPMPIALFLLVAIAAPASLRAEPGASAEAAPSASAIEGIAPLSPAAAIAIGAADEETALPDQEIAAPEGDPPNAASPISAPTTEAEPEAIPPEVEGGIDLPIEGASALPSVEDLFGDEPSPQEVADDAARQERDARARREAKSASGARRVLEESARRFAAVREFVRGLSAERRARFSMRPYVAGEGWERAMEAWQGGQCQAALDVASAQAGPDPDPVVRAVLAEIKLCAGRQGEGRAELSAIAQGTGPAARYARRALGMPDPPIEARPKTEPAEASARALAAAGQVGAALKALEARADSAGSGWSWYRAKLAAAEIQEASGRIDEAAETLHAIYVRTRRWRSGRAIERMIEAFERRQRRTVIDTGDRADRMRELIARGRYKEAKRASIENAKRAKVSGAEVRGWSLYRQALVAERKKKRERASSLFAKAERSVKTPAIRARIYFGWARALRRIHRDSEAIELYERLCREYATDRLCPEALFEAGRLLQYAEKHNEALAKFNALIARHPRHEDVPAALWRSAFSHYLLGRWEAAEAPLHAIRAEHAERRDASDLPIGLKAQYWLGVVALKRGDRAEAARRLQTTIDEAPLSWYGRLAAARLESIGRRPILALPARRLAADDLRRFEKLWLPRDEAMELAVTYARLGLIDRAQAEARRAAPHAAHPRSARRLLAALQLASGRPDVAHWAMRREIGYRPEPETLRDWGTAFPLDYMEHAHAWGSRYGVDPFLVQAIIRQESGFRPKVKSWAGALGLMQLMPGTARYTAKVFLDEEAERQCGRSDLLIPERNVRLGAMYIRVHTAHAADNVALALAGYNAGPKPLRRWHERYGDRELDAWVESITYREARGYVRKVMTSYFTYAGLYGDGTLPSLSLKLPENLGRWGEVPRPEQVKIGGEVSEYLGARPSASFGGLTRGGG